GGAGGAAPFDNQILCITSYLVHYGFWRGLFQIYSEKIAGARDVGFCNTGIEGRIHELARGGTAELGRVGRGAKDVIADREVQAGRSWKILLEIFGKSGLP